MIYIDTSLVTDRGCDAKGKLWVSVPVKFGRRVIAPHLGDFLACYPAVEISLNLTDDRVNLFREPVELAIRLGSTVSREDVICAGLGHFQRWLVASPASWRSMPACASTTAG
jgi:DNA-binding transcriptional LysR family regulator